MNRVKANVTSNQFSTTKLFIYTPHTSFSKIKIVILIEFIRVQSFVEYTRMVTAFFIVTSEHDNSKYVQPTKFQIKWINLL